MVSSELQGQSSNMDIQESPGFRNDAVGLCCDLQFKRYINFVTLPHFSTYSNTNDPEQSLLTETKLITAEANSHPARIQSSQI